MFLFLVFSTGSDGFSYYCCIFTERVLLSVRDSKTTPHHATKPSKCDSCLIIQLDLNRGMIHQGREFVCVTHLVNAFLWYFCSSTSLLNLGGGGSLCTTALSPTDSTGEINNHLFAERLSVSERERERE